MMRFYAAMLALAFMSTAAWAQTTLPVVKPDTDGATQSLPLPHDENNKPIEGICRVALEVDKNGAPKKPHLIACTDSRLGDYAVAKTTKKQFVPAMKNGKPVSIKTTLEIDITDHAMMPDVQTESQFPVGTEPRKTPLPGGRVSAPSLVYGPDAKFPESAQGHPTNLKVNIKLIVNRLGGVEQPTVTKSGGTDFDQSALQAVRTYLFKPALQDGKPVAVTVFVEVGFTID